MRCIGGWKCDGYPEIQPSKKKRSRSRTGYSSNEIETEPDLALGLARSMTEPDKVGLSTHEYFFLDFFHTEGAFNGYGPPYDILFAGIALQISTWNPAVKHAAIALTASGNARSYSYWDRFGDRGRAKLNFALKQISKSIMHLLQQQAAPEDLTSRHVHREVVLITCFFFIWVANCLEDLVTAKMHFTYVQRALGEWNQVDFDGSSIGRELFHGWCDLTSRLQLLDKPALFLQDDYPLLLHAAWDLGSFDVSNLEYQVKKRYFEYFWSPITLPHIQDGFRAGSVDDSDPTMYTRQVAILFKARIFLRQLKAYFQLVGPLAAEPFQDLLMLLILWEQAMFAKISAAVAADEDPVWKPLQMRYDALWPYFRRINELGKKLLGLQIRQGVSKPSFPIDSAVITPLFLCGLYCRDWSIRREALQLIKAWGERFKGSSSSTEFLPINISVLERTWGERFTSSTACLPMKASALERIIDIESHGLQPGTVVPESARIHFVEFTGRPGSSDIGFSYLQLGMSRVDLLQQKARIRPIPQSC